MIGTAIAKPVGKQTPSRSQIDNDHASASARTDRSFTGVAGGPPTPGAKGFVEVQRVAGRSVTTRAYATSPLKLMTPRGADPTAYVYTSTYGGGLVAGDHLDLQVRVGKSSVCVLGTQASTKIYRSHLGQTCGQSLTATIDDDGSLSVVPDPVTCFAGAAYEHRQQFQLHRNASLLMIDWLTSGRMARDERWAFLRMRSRSDVYIDRRLVFTDALLLDPLDGAIDAPNRMGRFNCLATVVMIGPQMTSASQHVIDQIGAVPLGGDAPFIGTASRFEHGVVLRLMGTTTERVERFLKTAIRLPAQRADVGVGPKGTSGGPGARGGQPLWSRKW